MHFPPPNQITNIWSDFPFLLDSSQTGFSGASYTQDPWAKYWLRTLAQPRTCKKLMKCKMCCPPRSSRSSSTSPEREIGDTFGTKHKGTVSPVLEFQELSRALGANPFSLRSWLYFGACEMPGGLPGSHGLGIAAPSLLLTLLSPVFLFPDDWVKWTEEFLWSTCSPSVPINIWVFILNMGCEKNPVNLRKRILSATEWDSLSPCKSTGIYL